MKCLPQQLGATESQKFWRAGDIGDLELLHARYVQHSFARHTHEGAAIGVIQEGVESFHYRGARHVAVADQIVLFNPGEVHTGEAADGGGWRFRMFYLDAGLLRDAVSEATGRAQDVPFFPQAVVEDAALSRRLKNLHLRLETSSCLLERQTEFLAVFAALAARHADSRPRAVPRAKEPAAVRRAREFLEEHSTENVSLEQLATIAELSPYHLVHIFRLHVGLPPHAYLEQVRINRAKQKIRSGSTILDTALATGFTDQSHFTRHFKRMVGVTPGVYAATARTYKTVVRGLPRLAPE